MNACVCVCAFVRACACVFVWWRVCMVAYFCLCKCVIVLVLRDRLFARVCGGLSVCFFLCI